MATSPFQDAVATELEFAAWWESRAALFGLKLEDERVARTAWHEAHRALCAADDGHSAELRAIRNNLEGR